eukprot:COSAG02_NODE_2215_length_9489_cov_4.810011_3_plen_134_part_00
MGDHCADGESSNKGFLHLCRAEQLAHKRSPRCSRARRDCTAVRVHYYGGLGGYDTARAAMVHKHTVRPAREVRARGAARGPARSSQPGHIEDRVWYGCYAFAITLEKVSLDGLPDTAICTERFRSVLLSFDLS